MLSRRAVRVMARSQLARPCWSGKRLSVVPWPRSTGMSSRRPCAVWKAGPLRPKNSGMSSVPGIDPSGQVPVAAPSTSAL